MFQDYFRINMSFSSLSIFWVAIHNQQVQYRHIKPHGGDMHRLRSNVHQLLKDFQGRLHLPSPYSMAMAHFWTLPLVLLWG